MTQHTADLILFNARVLTLDPKMPTAQVVAIRGERILAVGNDPEPWTGPGTRRINCQGKTIVPGFNDAHCHILSYVHSLLSLDFSPAKVKSISQMQALLRQRAQEAPPGSWITATGYNEFYLEEKRHPTRRDLDEATPHHPVRLLHRSGHAQALNSLALSLVGISPETPEPPGGLIDRDWETGEPNGLLFEMNQMVAQRIPLLGPEELKKGLALADRSYLSQGITSLQDASVSNGPAQWELFQNIKETGQLIPRLSLMIGHAALDDFLSQGMAPSASSGQGPGRGDYQLRLGAIKLVLDESSGSLYPPQPELNEIVGRAHKAGYQVAIHAIDTVEAAATALEYALGQHPRPHRHRIEHCSVCPPETLKRLARLGVLVATQPAFLYYSGERYLSEVPQRQLPWLYRIRSFKEARLRPAAGSDSPVAGNNPLVGIYAAITRRAETGQAILPEEAISSQGALEMYTSAAAYASYEEAEKGTISSGKLADLVALSHDPTAVPPDEIRDIKVDLTVVGGRVVWERD